MKRYVFLLWLLILLGACTPTALQPKVGVTTLDNKKIETFTSKSTLDKNPSYTPTPNMFFPTSDAILDAYSARSTQMAGMLSISVSKIDAKCYAFGSHIPVKFVFQNQTSAPITVQSRFIMSMNQDFHGDIIPKFSTTKGEKIYSEVDGLVIETEAEWTVPKDFIEINPHGHIEITKEFFFPTKTSQYGTIHLKDFEPLIEGNYRVEFEYNNMTVGPENTWSGYLNSNSIEVCMHRAK